MKIKKGKKKIKRKNHFGITSKTWRDYHEVKENQKREAAKLKEIKAQERVEKNS